MIKNFYTECLISLTLVTCLPMSLKAYDFKVDDIYYRSGGSDDDGSFYAYVTYGGTSYNSYSGDVVIPETFTYNSRTYTVIGIDASAFRNSTGLTSISIPSSVRIISGYAFYGCSSLTSITIPDAVRTIGDYTFRGCTSLTSLTIPATASYTTYHDSSTKRAFENDVITDLKITGEGSIMEYAFYKSTALQNVTICDNITSIGDHAFCYCSSLTSINIPDSVTSIGDGAFTPMYLKGYKQRGIFENNDR